MVSIVILTFNSLKFIRPCLESVYSQEDKEFEVIIVDNGSGDGTVDFLKNSYPGIKLIENRQNLGACKGRNQGIGVASGQWVLTLDCDIVLEKNFLSKAAEAIEALPEDVGIIQPKILNFDRQTTYSCGIYLSRLRRFYDIGRNKRGAGQFNTPKYVFGACSAAALYRNAMLEEINEKTGYFDERFFFLVEDVDLAWRAQRKGYKAFYYPKAVCYHRGDSSDTSKMTRQYFCFRNRYLMIKKNENPFGKVMLFFFSFPYEIFRYFYLFIIKAGLSVKWNKLDSRPWLRKHGIRFRQGRGQRFV